MFEAATGVLLPPITCVLTLEHDFDPKSLHTNNRLGLYGGFCNGGWLTAEASPLPAGTIFHLSVHEYVARCGTSDPVIKKALGAGHEFDATQTCGIFVALLAGWRSGDQRFAGTNTLFISKRVVAGLFFCPENGIYADTRGPKTDRYHSGSRVLSPAC